MPVPLPPQASPLRATAATPIAAAAVLSSLSASPRARALSQMSVSRANSEPQQTRLNFVSPSNAAQFFKEFGPSSLVRFRLGNGLGLGTTPKMNSGPTSPI